MDTKDKAKDTKTEFKKAKRSSSLWIAGVIILVLGILLRWVLHRKFLGLVLVILGIIIIILARRKIKAQISS